MYRRIKGFYQYNQEDCGAASLATILHFYNKKTSISILRNEISYDKNGANVLSIIEVAKKYGVGAEAYEGDYEELEEQVHQKQFKYPMIVHVDRKDLGGHYLVVKRIHKGNIKVFDPKDGHVTLSTEEFIAQWTGIVICFEQDGTLKSKGLGEKKPFENYHRYLKILYKAKSLFITAILLSVLVSLISFIGAWIYKIVIDNYILKQPTNENFEANDINFTVLIISLLIFYVFQTGLLLIKNIFNAKAARSLSDKLSESFLKHIIKIPQKTLSNFETGEILSRFQSISQIQQSYLSVIFTLTTEAIGAVIGGIFTTP
ncbi:membrane hypothetical protein [Bacillus sp. 349Y]|nr:membrane hypothetical protein [Bacillus sp. 349Y]